MHLKVTSLFSRTKLYPALFRGKSLANVVHWTPCGTHCGTENQVSLNIGLPEWYTCQIACNFRYTWLATFTDKGVQKTKALHAGVHFFSTESIYWKPSILGAVPIWRWIFKSYFTYDRWFSKPRSPEKDSQFWAVLNIYVTYDRHFSNPVIYNRLFLKYVTYNRRFSKPVTYDRQYSKPMSPTTGGSQNLCYLWQAVLKNLCHLQQAVYKTAQIALEMDHYYWDLNKPFHNMLWI